MAAMKPRTGDGPLEAEKEGRGIVMRIPSEGGGRLVIELSAEEAQELAQALANAVRHSRRPQESDFRHRALCRQSLHPDNLHASRCGYPRHDGFLLRQPEA